MKEKYCPGCESIKNIVHFGENHKRKDGYRIHCRDCRKEQYERYYRTVPGMITAIYTAQKVKSRERRMSAPSYTKEEFKDWLCKQPNFLMLYNKWLYSGCEKMKKPSVNRKNDYKPYTFDNIELDTWRYNWEKSNLDRISGINNKCNISVKRISKDTGEIVEYHSISEAARMNNCSSGGISEARNGKKEIFIGYIWE